jgi:hypothetical protein
VKEVKATPEFAEFMVTLDAKPLPRVRAPQSVLQLADNVVVHAGRVLSIHESVSAENPPFRAERRRS